MRSFQDDLEHKLKMLRRKAARAARLVTVRVKTGKYDPRVEDEKHAKQRAATERSAGKEENARRAEAV